MGTYKTLFTIMRVHRLHENTIYAYEYNRGMRYTVVGEDYSPYYFFKTLKEALDFIVKRISNEIKFEERRISYARARLEKYKELNEKILREGREPFYYK